MRAGAHGIAALGIKCRGIAASLVPSPAPVEPLSKMADVELSENEPLVGDGTLRGEYLERKVALRRPPTHDRTHDVYMSQMRC